MSGDSISPFNGLANAGVAPPAPSAPAAPAERMRSDQLGNWLSGARSEPAPIVATSQTTPAPVVAEATSEPPAPQAEHQAQTMAPEEVAALDQQWAALRSAIKADDLPAVVKSFQGGELPAQLMASTVRFQHLGQEVAMPVAELVRGHMRLRDYGRRMNELKAAEQRQSTFMGNLNAMLTSWDDPHAYISSMRRLGKTAQFEAAAMALARIKLEEKAMTPAERETRRLREEMAERERQYEARIQALEQREKGQQQQSRTDGITKQLAAWVPGAFQKHGVPDFPMAGQWFMSNLESIWHVGELTPQLVDDAAAMTSEQYREALAQHTAGQQRAASLAPPAARAALPVQAAAGNAGANPAQARRMRVADFDTWRRGAAR